jgi:HEXXH motif-containing protein
VIIPQADPNGLFWSGSNGEYVGRVVLVNSDQERVSIEEVVDALVHEAIHGFLYMHESVEPWVVDRSLYTDEAAIESPWSGTLLPVRPFMQACFVWYGLAMFWALHVGGTVFDRERTHYLLSRSLSGFRGRSLTDLLAPSREGVRPDMLDVIDELQQTVRSLLA